MKQNLRVSLGAVVLALATLAAMIFAWLNFVQRQSFETPDDGVAWLDTATGAQAWKLAPNSPAAQAGVRAGDFLISINNVPVRSQVQVTRRLWHAGLWTQVRYKLVRNGREFETPIVTAPAEKPNSIENYGRFVGLLYLFIGLFIFVRRWNAPRAIHFYVFCLVSFILYSFQYSGKLDAFDYEVYWASVVARLLAQHVQVFHGEATVLGQRQRLRTRDLRGHIRHHGCFLVAIETQGLLLTSRAVGSLPTSPHNSFSDLLKPGTESFFQRDRHLRWPRAFAFV